MTRSRRTRGAGGSTPGTRRSLATLSSAHARPTRRETCSRLTNAGTSRAARITRCSGCTPSWARWTESKRRRTPSSLSDVGRQTAPSEAVDRLLQAWHGEIEANKMYGLLAERLGNSRRGEIIRSIAAADARHRQRIERRLRELGQPIPDPSTVNLSPMQRLQARIAPIA